MNQIDERKKIETFPEELFLIENENKNYSQLFEKFISGNIFLPESCFFRAEDM